MQENRQFNVRTKARGNKAAMISYRDATQVVDNLKRHAISLSTSSLYRMKKNDEKLFTTPSGIKITVICTN